jgi:hypothetical protein
MQTLPMVSLTQTVSSVPYIAIAVIIIVILAFIGYIVYLKIVAAQPSDANLAALCLERSKLVEDYPKNMTNRLGLIKYLTDVIPTVPANRLAVTNFHVMTANLGGYFSPVGNAAFCKTAIQYAIQAGARCLIFDVWPNPKKGANMGPILKVCQSDDNYDIIGNSYYSMDLVTALTEVKKWAFEDSANPGNQDPMFLYFRFRGKPTANTLTGTANAISVALEQYRLPFIYSSTTATNNLYTIPINELTRKIIILSNNPGTGTRFAEYINNPATATSSIFTPGEIKGLTGEQVKTFDDDATTKFIACAPRPEDTGNSESNSWSWKRAHEVGIQFCGLNLWVQDNGLKAYLDPKEGIFGKYSFLLKSDIKPTPENTTEGFASLYKIERVPPPTPVKDLGYGNGTISVK